MNSALAKSWAAVVISSLVSVAAHAAVTFEYSLVADPGNAADSTGYGAVAQSFLLSKTEVTNAQYAEFLNKVRPNGRLPGDGNSFIYGPDAQVENHGVTGIIEVPGNAVGSKWVVKAGHENKPVNFVSAKAAARFVNWLSNGQGSGGTESGVYTISGGPLVRAAGAKVYLPNADEWYKAAYYKGGGPNAGYWTYANSSDTTPVSAPAGTVHGANYFYNDLLDNGINGGYAVTGVADVLDLTVDYLTAVGAYPTTLGPYGHFDLIGNVGEWIETIVNSTYRPAGGGFADIPQSISRANYPPSVGSNGEDGYSTVGFRVAISVPEPSAGLLVLGLGFTLRRRMP